MDNRDMYTQVTETFSNYGMRKTSMDDLSRVMGVSRQTLYNRFQTKEAIREWAVEGFTQVNTDKAIEVLEKSKKTPDKTIVEALDRWAGDHFPLWVKTPHGAEILDYNTDSLLEKKNSAVSSFEKSLIKYLIENNIAKNEAAASDITFSIMLALKGTFAVCNTSEEFTNSMQRVIRLLI